MFGFNIFLGGLAGGLKKGDGSSGGVDSTNLKTTGIKDAIGGSAGNSQIQNAIAQLVQQELGLSVKETDAGGQNKKDITAEHDANTGDQKVHVTIKDSSTSAKTVTGETSETVLAENNKVTITIKVVGDPTTVTGGDEKAKKIAEKIWEAAKKAKDQANAGISAKRDFGAFQFIAFHDILAMFCRFVYGKFAVGYNSTRAYI